ncbi:hypothetical protein P154DRAFT_533075 [Amniculicola lignicola CBS 123094]|uniref:Uncharacterized protein n=1 Tax=Amniculicola lignicola CBS 123094 TaxID=1392246 RepID=A0A6A5WTU7_9PLEO|nr:hypothetical protein P154DRAFT_533075 [Amniculicola lignicola CBS 123094]
MDEEEQQRQEKERVQKQIEADEECARRLAAEFNRPSAKMTDAEYAMQLQQELDEESDRSKGRSHVWQAGPSRQPDISSRENSPSPPIPGRATDEDIIMGLESDDDNPGGFLEGLALSETSSGVNSSEDPFDTGEDPLDSDEESSSSSKENVATVRLFERIEEACKARGIAEEDEIPERPATALGCREEQEKPLINLRRSTRSLPTPQEYKVHFDEYGRPTVDPETRAKFLRKKGLSEEEIRNWRAPPPQAKQEGKADSPENDDTRPAPKLKLILKPPKLPPSSTIDLDPKKKGLASSINDIDMMEDESSWIQYKFKSPEPPATMPADRSAPTENLLFPTALNSMPRGSHLHSLERIDTGMPLTKSDIAHINFALDQAQGFQEVEARTILKNLRIKELLRERNPHYTMSFLWRLHGPPCNREYGVFISLDQNSLEDPETDPYFADRDNLPSCCQFGCGPGCPPCALYPGQPYRNEIARNRKLRRQLQRRRYPGSYVPKRRPVKRGNKNGYPIPIEGMTYGSDEESDSEDDDDPDKMRPPKQICAEGRHQDAKGNSEEFRPDALRGNGLAEPMPLEEWLDTPDGKKRSALFYELAPGITREQLETWTKAFRMQGPTRRLLHSENIQAADRKSARKVWFADPISSAPRGAQSHVPTRPSPAQRWGYSKEPRGVGSHIPTGLGSSRAPRQGFGLIQRPPTPPRGTKSRVLSPMRENRFERKNDVDADHDFAREAADSEEAGAAEYAGIDLDGFSPLERQPSREHPKHRETVDEFFSDSDKKPDSDVDIRNNRPKPPARKQSVGFIPDNNPEHTSLPPSLPKKLRVTNPDPYTEMDEYKPGSLVAGRAIHTRRRNPSRPDTWRRVIDTKPTLHKHRPFTPSKLREALTSIEEVPPLTPPESDDGGSDARRDSFCQLDLPAVGGEETEINASSSSNVGGGVMEETGDDAADLSNLPGGVVEEMEINDLNLSEHHQVSVEVTEVDVSSSPEESHVVVEEREVDASDSSEDPKAVAEVTEVNASNSPEDPNAKLKDMDNDYPSPLEDLKAGMRDMHVDPLDPTANPQTVPMHEEEETAALDSTQGPSDNLRDPAPDPNADEKDASGDVVMGDDNPAQPEEPLDKDPSVDP